MPQQFDAKNGHRKSSERSILYFDLQPDGLASLHLAQTYCIPMSKKFAAIIGDDGELYKSDAVAM